MYNDLYKRCDALQLDALGDTRADSHMRISVIVQSEMIKRRMEQQARRNEREIRMLCDDLGLSFLK